jgi:hypothetical protein
MLTLPNASTITTESWLPAGGWQTPDRVAERSFSYEAGADYFATKNLKVSGTFFQRFHDDLIDYVTTPYSQMPRQINLSPTGTYALARNYCGGQYYRIRNRCSIQLSAYRYQSALVNTWVSLDEES